MMIAKRAAALICLSLLCAASRWMCYAQAPETDKVVFKNGDVLSGSVRDLSSTTVSFDGGVTGRIELKWSDIKSIEVSAELWEKTIGDAKIDKATLDKIAHHSAGNAMVVPSAPAPPPSSDANVVSHWSGTLSSQDSVTRSSQNQYQLGGALHVAYETTAQTAYSHQIVSLNSNATFGEAEKPKASPVRTALFTGALSYNLFLKDSALKQNFPSPYDSFYFLGVAEEYHNLSLGIDIQQSYGVGMGWLRTVKSAPNSQGDQVAQVFGLQADIRYSHQQLYSPGGRADLIGSGLRESYSISIPWPFGAKAKPMNISESVVGIPYYTNPQWWQVQGVGSLTIPLTKDQRLQIGPKFTDDYFENSPKGSRQNYFQPSLTLSFCFNPIATCH